MCEKLGWLPYHEYTDREEQDEYDHAQSMTFVALDDQENCVGTSRLIFPGEIRLPIEKYFKLYPKKFIETLYGNLRHYAEVSRFIVPDNKSVKRHEITLMLCRAMIHAGMNMRVSHMLMSADHRFFRLMKMIGFHLMEIGEPEFYMGSKTIPGILPMENLYPVLKEKKPALYEYLTEGSETGKDMAAVHVSGIKTFQENPGGI